LTIDDDFTGFTLEQVVGIARSAHHFAKPRFRGKQRMPICVMGGQQFEITRVRSEGLRQQVRRRDGKWLTISGPTVIGWQEKGPPPGTPVDERSAEAPEPSPQDAMQRILSAMRRVQDCQALLEQAAKDLWGIAAASNERESILKLYYQTASLKPRLDNRRIETSDAGAHRASATPSTSAASPMTNP
jgi:hypothetical protein